MQNIKHGYQVSFPGGLDGPGSNSGGSEIFRTPPDRPWGPPSFLQHGYQVSFPGVKRPERGVNYPRLSSAEVKERVELYLYSHFGPSWPITGRNLVYFYILCQPNVLLGTGTSDYKTKTYSSC